MYETCGRLYQAGLPGCGLFELALKTWREAFGEEVDEPESRGSPSLARP